MRSPVVNSAAYWDARFESGDWERHGGPEQTRFFARVALAEVPSAVLADIRSRRGTVCDWGCAEGEATRIITERWRVPVVGVDASRVAVARARARNPGLDFTCSSEGLDREYDVLFTSNTLEHFPSPFDVLAPLLARVRRYALVLVPFEEDPRIPEHAFTFRWESFPLRLGGFDLVGLAVVDCARLEGSRWPGRQVLATYAHPATGAAAGANARALVSGALARATAAEGRIAQAEAKLAETNDLLESLRSRLATLATELDLAHGRRWYGVGRALAGCRHRPGVAAIASARWLRARVAGRPASIPDLLEAPDVLRDMAAALRRLRQDVVSSKPPPESEDGYVTALREIEERCRAPAEGPRARHAAAVDALEARASRSRGVVVYPPVLNWGYLRQRPQQVMIELGRRGWTCVFLPPNPEVDGVDGLREVEPGVFLCSDVGLLRHLRDVVLWVTWAPNAAYAAAFDSPRVVYEFIDELQLFHLYGPGLEAHHARLVRTADVVVASADRLLAQVRPERPDAVLAPNGVRPEDFGEDRSGALPEDLAPVIARGAPVVGYHGAIARWFDVALLNAVAAAAPDLSFVVVGPDYDGSAGAISRRPNVHLLGQKSYADLVRYTRRFDVAIIPFVVDEITRATSPVKLFEYFASGTPVVSTPLDECRKHPPVAVAAGRDDFLAAIRAAVGKRRDPAYARLLAEEVTRHTWAERVDRILAALEGVRAVTASRPAPRADLAEGENDEHPGAR